MAMELDPQFIKALRLLRSKSKDSGAQLKSMLDEAIRQKKGLTSGSSSASNLSNPNGSRTVSSERLEKEKKKELDRLKKDLSELTDRPSDPKRARLDSPGLSTSSHSPSPSPPGSEGGSEVDYGDLEMNLEDQFDCSCCVCKTFTQESGNKLMECSSCQNLYHQECHNPPVNNEKASDPRLIWNCDKCSNKGKSVSNKMGSSAVKEERKAEKEKSWSRSSSSSSSSKVKASPLKTESRGAAGPGLGLTLTSVSSSRSTQLTSSATSSVTAPGSGTELSSSAKKRLKILKQQATDMTSISKKKSSK